MGRKSFKVLLIKDKTSALRAFEFTKLSMIFLSFLTTVILGFSVYTTSRFLANIMTESGMAEIVSENSELHRELDLMNQRVEDFTVKLNELVATDDKLRVLADMPKIDEDTRQVGIGGTSLLHYSSTYGSESATKIQFDLDKIEREIRLQRTSFIEIDRQMRENADLIAHTPSIRPIQGGFISSKFGYRKDPFTGKRAHHNGIDYSVEIGTPIYSTANGKVVFAKRAPGMGRTVIIDHGYGFRTAYGHMSRMLVKKNQTIERNQKIGEVGNSGRSTGPHLHYEVQVDRKAVNPIDYLFDDFAVRQ